MRSMMLIAIYIIIVTSPLVTLANERNDQITFEISTTPTGINKIQDIVGKISNNEKLVATKTVINDNNAYNWDLIAIITTIILAFLAGVFIVVRIIIKLASQLYEEAKKTAENANKKAESIEQRYINSTKAEVENKLKTLDFEIKKVKEILIDSDTNLSKLKVTNELTTIKLSAIAKTLMLCLERAPSRDIAFSTYSKLLSAYEVLLNNSHETIPRKLQEEMEMAATLVSGNKQYVPKEIIRFMIESMNLPYEVRGILWGKV